MFLIKKLKKHKYNLLVLLFFVLVFGIFINLNILSASAQKSLEITYPEIPGAKAPTSTTTALPTYIKYIFNLSIAIAGLVAFGGLIYGGFHYLTSSGNPSAMANAKDQILAAFLGLTLILSSWLILHTINPQLTTIHISKLVKNTIPKGSAPPPFHPHPKKKTEYTFFQVPVGKIIERAIFGDEAKENFNQLIEISKELEKKTKKLKKLSKELKDITDACGCEDSSCAAEGCYGGSPDCPISPKCNPDQNCKPKGCPKAHCDKEAIKNKSDEIESAITDIQDTQQRLSSHNFLLTNNILEIQKAYTLITLSSDVIRDYNNMLSLKRYLENQGKKVNLAYFPGWEAIKIKLNGQTINDPATFYLNKENNKDIIAAAETFDGAGMTLPPPDTFSPAPPPPPSSSPPLESTEGILNVPVFHQDTGDWWNSTIDSCPNRKDKKMWYSGCGITSLAMVLRALGFNVTPADISNEISKYRPKAFDCEDSHGSYIGRLANLAKKEYGVSYKTISYKQLKSEIEANHPIITHCTNFNNFGWAHIIVIRGIKNGYVYINDPMSRNYKRLTRMNFPPYHNGKLSIETYKKYHCGGYYYSFSK